MSPEATGDPGSGSEIIIYPSEDGRSRIHGIPGTHLIRVFRVHITDCLGLFWFRSRPYWPASWGLNYC